MNIQDLYTLLAHSVESRLQEVDSLLQTESTSHFLFQHLYASMRAVLVATLNRQTKRHYIVVLDSSDEAQYWYNDLLTIGANAYYFPSSVTRRGIDSSMAIQRTEVLTALTHLDTPAIIVTYPEAITEPVPKREELSGKTLHIKRGETISISTLVEFLSDMGFERVDFVYEPGQYAVRGGIVDIFSYSHDDPYRLDFWGDEVDSIRCFELETQLSKDERPEQCDIIGLPQGTQDGEDRTIIDEYVQADCIWVSTDWAMVQPSLEEHISFAHVPTIEIRDNSYFAHVHTIDWQTKPQPLFHKNFDLLSADIREKFQQGYALYIVADQKKQTDRLDAILREALQIPDRIFVPVDHTLHEGWIDNAAKIVCYTDHQIFERYHRVNLRSENAKRGKAILTLKELNQLQIDDYIVHTDHGIGQFGGLVTTSVNGKPQEMIKLIFRDGDTIYVSIHNLHRLSKYKGKEGIAPTISKLGSGAWERLKERTKDKVKDIARELITLYAKRKDQPGVAYSPDSYMQHELEASFLYEDTPDQARATMDVKKDLESIKPMDRLICGDVGFGKTEVAMRAAFKVATDGKQVAVLVPTTVLALQHYHTFCERFKDFPVKVDYLSRARSTADTKQILQNLKDGKIDILIGTHKIVGKQVVWHDLGLLIIDEEQKFGVSVKEKIKSYKTNIDVLTLTATPIPRTLQFSLLGARDLSVINTPPPNRYPIQTELIGIEDEDIVKTAIDNELSRNGQVFVVNNRIEMLERIEQRIHRLCPDARIVTAHGQMPSEEMEQRLEAFINYDYDVLISTTIIESGVDISNVNTIIIYSAQHFGLADLHQLRGRVGRSNRKAYCYLITPDRSLLTPEARKRLDAFSIFGELGSGFKLAMQDLDIRGAGNLLGAEQSGFIAELGYETYQKILSEAVAEIKEELGQSTSSDAASSIFSPHSSTANDSQSAAKWCNDTLLESDLPLFFPADYIENISERLTLYKELDGLRDEQELEAYKRRLVDRFGPMPAEAEELMNVVRLRWICEQLGIEKIFLKGEQMTLYFVSHNDRYWSSETFGRVIEFLIARVQRCRLVEEKDRKTGQPTGKRYAVVKDVRTIQGAITFLSKIEN